MGQSDLNSEIIKIIAAESSRVTIETLNREEQRRQEEKRKSIIRNMKRLISSYRLIKAHSVNAVYQSKNTPSRTKEVIDMLWEGSEFEADEYLDSIRRSATKSAMLVEHIDIMLQLYAKFAELSNDEEAKRRKRVVDMLYISEDHHKTVFEIANIENITTRTVYKDVEAVCEKLAVLVFGTYGLKMER